MSILKVNKLRAYNTADITIEDPVVFENSVDFVRLDPENFTGMVAGFAMNAVPDGWLVADGSAISRTTYATLFSKLGTLYGSGDGSTTFNIPDFRGMYLAGAGTNGTDIDPGDPTIGKYTGPNVGVLRRDQMQGHNHMAEGRNAPGDGVDMQLAVTGVAGEKDGIVTYPISDGTNGTPRTGLTTQSVAIGVLMCVKY